MDAYLLNETLISSSFSVNNLMKGRLKNEDRTLLKWPINYFIGLQQRELIRLTSFI